jgi:hypothetical protein
MCEECTKLIVRYKIATVAYKSIVSNIRGALNDDLKLVMSQVRELHAAGVKARTLMNAHWNTCHRGMDGLD